MAKVKNCKRNIMNYYPACTLYTATVIIYGLSDSKGLFYIGFTTGSLERRFDGHIREAVRNKDTQKSRRILENEFQFSIYPIETFQIAGPTFNIPVKKIMDRENWWINYYRELGLQLCNVYPLVKQNSSVLR